MQIKEVAATLERFAPLSLQESYDNAGFQVGLTEAEVSGVLLCLDVTEAAVRAAAESGCNLIVAHHPLLFHGLKCVGDATQPERCVRLAIQLGVAVYAAHTNLDNAPGGVCFTMAGQLGLTDVRSLTPQHRADGLDAVGGLIGCLPEAETATAFLDRVKAAFGAASLRHSAPLGRPIRTVALCGGAGASFIDDALRAGADAYVTGEASYHHFFGLEERMMLVTTGHYESEQYAVDLLASILRDAFPGLTLRQFGSTNPVFYH